jgi:prepilin-type N-terminal cleavage/methylation domain-containing protein
MRLSDFHFSHRRATGGRARIPAGFTLIEVMMAVTILALALTTSITTLQRAFLNLDSARNIETACRIMQCELEKERLLSWSQVSDNSYQPTMDPAFLGNPAVAGRFTLSRQTATVANTADKLLQITLTVTWKNYDGHAAQRSQTTYYGNGGLYTYFTSQS